MKSINAVKAKSTRLPVKPTHIIDDEDYDNAVGPWTKGPPVSEAQLKEMDDMWAAYRAVQQEMEGYGLTEAFKRVQHARSEADLEADFGNPLGGARSFIHAAVAEIPARRTHRGRSFFAYYVTRTVKDYVSAQPELTGTQRNLLRDELDLALQKAYTKAVQIKKVGRPSGSLVDATELVRRRGEFSQRDLAEQSDVSEQTIRGGEKGGRKWTISTFIGVARGLSELGQPTKPEDLQNKTSVRNSKK